MNPYKFLFLIIVLLASACMPLQSGEPTIPTDDNLPSLADSTWSLKSFGEPGAETSVINGSSITLAFEGNGQAGGYSGCNSYSGPYSVQGQTLKFAEISSTLIACEFSSITDQEQDYLNALRAAGRFNVDGESLTIWYEGESRVLNFVYVPAAMNPPEPTAGAVPGKDVGARIEFPVGQNSAEVFAELAAGMTDSYIVRGQQGRMMSVEITSPDNDVLLSVVGKDGTPLKRYQNGPPSWTGELPATQDYILRAVSVGQSTSYTVRVSIEPPASSDPERVAFEPGATTATRSGDLSGGEVKEYVLTGKAGQRMHIQTVGDGAPVYLTLTSPSGDITLNSSVGDRWTGESQTRDSHVFAAQVLLPETGDYVVRLSVPQGAESTRYDVAFTIDNDPLPTVP